jgi:hypothetical protein
VPPPSPPLPPPSLPGLFATPKRRIMAAFPGPCPAPQEEIP